MIFLIALLISSEFLINIGLPVPLLAFLIPLYNGKKSIKLFTITFPIKLQSAEGIYQLIIFFLFLAVPLHYSTGVFNVSYLRDLGRVLISIFLSYNIYIAAYSHVKRNGLKIVNNFYALCAITLFICFLEVLPGIGESIQGFYESLTSQFAINSIDSIRSVGRNLGIFGRRPLFFTTEPSHVAKLSLNLTFILILLQIYSRKKNFIIPLAFAGFSLFLIQSPIAFFAVFLAGVFYLVYSTSSLRLVVLAISFASFPLVISFFSTRNDFALLGSDTRTIIKYAWQSSGAIRTIVPLILSNYILSTNYAYFGLGINAKYFAPTIFDWLNAIPEYGVLGTNALYKVFIFWGFYGISVILVLFYLMFQSLSSWKLFSLFSVYTLLMAYSTGSIDSYLLPSSLALLFGIKNSFEHLSGMTRIESM